MTQVSIAANFDDKQIKRLLKEVGSEAMFAQKSALRSVGGKARTQYIRRMVSKIKVARKGVASRTKHFAKGFDKRLGEVRQKVWVGAKRAITAKEDPKVLTSVAAGVGQVFDAKMPSGASGKFVRQNSWAKGPKNSYRRISRHYFERPDGQNTYLPITRPKVSLGTDESKRTLKDACRQIMDSKYAVALKKELETRVKRLRRKRQRRK